MSRSNNTTRVAYPGNGNETGSTPDALERMWIGVVHPPHPCSCGRFCREPSASHGWPLLNADDSVAWAGCNHAAVAALLNFQSNKDNNENESLPRHTGGRDQNRRTVNHHCQTSDPSIGRQYFTGARPDRSAISRPQRADSQCSGVENRQKRVACQHGNGRVSVRAGETSRLNRRKFVSVLYRIRRSDYDLFSSIHYPFIHAGRA